MYASLETSAFRCADYPQIYYPLNNTLIGSGQENDITFYSHASTNFTFPFSIEYTTTMSSSAEIIADLVTKCGVEGGTASDITVDYDITASRVLAARGISRDLITFSLLAGFACAFLHCLTNDQQLCQFPVSFDRFRHLCE